MDVGDGPGAVVFTDIVDFTRYNAEQGDDAALALLDHQSDVIRKLLPDCARVVKELGDGLMIWIPDAMATFDVCLAVHDALAEAPITGDPAVVRVGAHWGTPRRRGDDLVGNAVNLAARIVDLAGAGEVLVSEALLTAAGTPASVQTLELGPVYVKGIAEPVPLYRVERVAVDGPVAGD